VIRPINRTPRALLLFVRGEGFADVEVRDGSDWYRRRVREEYETIKTEFYPRMLELMSEQDADHFVENWRAMLVVCEKGEMI
jgi:lysyl-tRNA synthetase class I